MRVCARPSALRPFALLPLASFAALTISITLCSTAVLAQDQGAQKRETQAAPAIDAVPAAQKLLAATVTVRITANRSAPAGQPASGGEGVTVCSGVSLGEGKVVTFAASPSQCRFRVTLPGGEQAEARLAVADEYSGLVLLEILRRNQPGLAVADALPPVGSAVLTASAAGIEQPVVSLGILGGVDRSVPGSGLPPVLQCDVRTTETSSGAAVVDREGRLIGIIAATSANAEHGGWIYAVPMRHHVARLLQARADAGGDRANLPVDIKRRRPVLGLTMGPGEKEGTVRVERVEQSGPAAKGQIAVGDLIVEVDGRRIRSAYQAVDLVLKKQPGDPVELVVDSGAGPRRIGLVLEGGQPLAPTATDAGLPLRVGPQLNVRALSRSQLEVRQGGRVAELAVDPSAPEIAAGAAIGRDEIGLLKVQLAAFEKVIVRLQDELKRRDENQAKTDALIQSLTEEVSRLRKQLSEKRGG